MFPKKNGIIHTILKKYGNEARFIIDVKTKSLLQLKPAIKIAKIIKEFKLQGSVIISSFNPLLLLFIKCIDSKLLTGFIFINPKYLKLTNLIHPDFLHPRGDIINKKVYIAGDFNFDLTRIDSEETSDFFDMMTSSQLLPTILLPTKLNRQHDTLLDNIFTNQFNPDMSSGNFTMQISDHLASFLVVPNEN